MAASLSLSPTPHHPAESALDQARLGGDADAIVTACQSLLRQNSQQSIRGAVEKAYAALAEVSLAQGRLDEARAHARKALDGDAHSEDALIVSALLELRTDPSGSAAERRALAHLNALSWRRNAQFWRGEEARTVEPFRWQQLLKALYLRGTLLEAQGELEAAAGAYEEPWFLVAHHPVPQACVAALARAMAAAGRLRAALGDFDAALSYFRALLADSPPNLPAEALRALGASFARFLLLSMPAERWRPPTADKVRRPEGGDSAVGAAGGDTGGGGGGGYAYSPNSAEEEALLVLSTALRRNVPGEPKPLSDGELRSCLAVALARVGETERLVAQCRDALTLDLENFGLWFLLAVSLLQARRFGDAWESTLQCVYRNNSSLTILSLGCRLCFNYLGKPKEAAEFAERALAVMNGAPQTGDDDAAADGSGVHFPALIDSEMPLSLQARACTLMCGAACAKLAALSTRFAHRQNMQRRAMRLLSEALAIDASHQQTLFHLALLTAETRDPVSALQLARRSIELNRRHAPSWALMALVLSCKKQLVDAVHACDSGLEQCPGSGVLLLIKARLLARMGDFDRAVAYLSVLTERLFEEERAPADARVGGAAVGSSGLGAGLAAALRGSKSGGSAGDREPFTSFGERALEMAPPPHRVIFIHSTQPSASRRSQTSRRRPVFRARPPAAVDGAGPGGGGAAGGVEADRHSVASDPAAAPSGAGVGAGAGATAGAGVEWSSGSRAQRAAADPTHSAEKSAERFSLHCETALALAELYAQHAGDPDLDDAGRLLSDAFDCVYKARELSGGAYLPDIHSTLGRFCLQSGRLVEAARHFESALAVDAHHVDSLVGLATVESRRESGSLVLAYGYLTNALQVDGASHEAWAALGLVLRAQGKEALAAEHLLTALELERTAPAFAFSLVPRFL